MIFTLFRFRFRAFGIATSVAALLVAFNFSHAESANGPAPASAVTISSSGSGEIENSVVKVFATLRYPDPYRPWTKQAPTEVTGSGVIIEGDRILTNAHVVLYASQVQIQANQSGDKISATVEAIAPGIDLAVLKLDEPTFFATHHFLPRSSALPDIKDAVLAYGYPAGGTSLSITKGIISRIEFTAYNFPVSGLRIQIDAAINSGNSGGPAVVGDKMIGLAFSHLGNAQNIGYIIPNEEIELFLKDIADGHYDGKPALFDELQTFENPALHTFLRLEKSVEGMIVHRPVPVDDGLKEWDVITKIGDTPVDNQGMIKLGNSLRVRFFYLVQKIAQNGRVPLTLIREGKEKVVSLAVPTEHAMLIPDLSGSYPPYFILGPLTFSKATSQFVGFLGANAGAALGFGFVGSPLITRRGDLPSFPDEELVVIASPFFPHKLAKGYASNPTSVIRTMNGEKVKNLAQLVTLLRDSTADFIRLEMDNRGGETLVFPRREMIAATEEILADNGVRAQGSPELMAIWAQKKN